MPRKNRHRRGISRATLLVASIFVIAFGVGAWVYRDTLIAGLFGPPKVTLSEAYEEHADGPAFDHADFDTLVSRHVDEDGWVDYEGLQDEVAQLNRYIAKVGQAPFESLGRDQKLALLINAYNAFTLKLILEHYPIDSIRDISSSKRWNDVRWNVGGNQWSLRQIEHEQIRPKFREPRIHFALVCAAAGCPPLRKEAYVAERLEEQLESQAEYVHRHTTWLQLDAEGGVVRLTRLYLWYGGDFEQVDGGVLEYAAHFLPKLQHEISSGNSLRLRWLDYDWRLNGTRNRTSR